MSRKYTNFKEVTEQEFFDFIGNRNVHPSPVGEWSNEYGYKSEWKSPSGDIYGISDKKSYHIKA